MYGMDKRKFSSSVEEEVGVLKSGNVIAAFSPAKTKKTYYAVLGDRALELHESEKSQKKKRHARYLIDLSTCFNINRHFDGRLKYCVAIMTPDETLLLRTESDALTDEWYNVLMSALIPARALRLGRPVLANEFFECAWDVTLVEHPKLRKPVPSPEQLINLCKKDPSLLGPHRLCFYHHTIILCRRGIEPASLNDLPESGIPPFKATDFVEFPVGLKYSSVDFTDSEARQYLASFGCQERYFFMIMGRSSPSGSGELWALCVCEEVAADMHNKLNKIIERESEKKKKMPNGPLLRPSPTCRAHRDRSHTYGSTSKATAPTSKKLSVDELSLKERRAKLRGYKCAVDSFQDERRNCLPEQYSSSKKIDRTRSFDSKTSKMRHPSFTDLWESGTGSKGGIREEMLVENLQHFSLSRHRSSFTSSSAADETEDSGGTLRVIDAEEEANRAKTVVERQIEATIERMLPFELREQFMSHSESRKVISTISDHHSESDDRGDGTSCSAAGSSSINDDFLQTTPGEMSEDASGDNLEYAPMEMNSWSSGSASHLGVPIGEPQFNFEEVRSYVSDSSDSCYSSMAANGTSRAYSFGASHIMQHWPRHSGRKATHRDRGSPAPDSKRFSVTLPQNEYLQLTTRPTPSAYTSQEDARKRAFSLGSSKSWFQKPFRKLSRDFASRAHRLSSTSQASSSSSTGQPFAHSPNTSLLPTTLQAFIAPDPYPMFRGRSESIGSGRSVPYSKRQINNDHTGDHVPVNFGGGVIPFGQSTSSSIHSTESPSRSRTSSFGCGQRSYSVRDPGDIVVHNIDAEGESTWASLSRHVHERCKERCSNTLFTTAEFDELDDYVGRDPAEVRFPEIRVSSPRVGYEGQLITSSHSESRNSQIFETIQESLSGRSSPASSKGVSSADGAKDGEIHEGTDHKVDRNTFGNEEVERSEGEKESRRNFSTDPDSEYIPVDPSQLGK